MNTAIQLQAPLPLDQNRVPVSHAVNQGRLDDEVDKYQHLEELAELFLTAKRHHPLPSPSGESQLL